MDYSDPASLVAALQGQDGLIITLSGRSSIEETEAKLIHAAAEAGVKWILPNEWSPDPTHEGFLNDLGFLFQPKANTRALFEKLGKSSYTAMVTGFWYEYSLALPGNFGFDFAKKEVMFFDQGKSKISVSTWPHIGRAVAALLSLPLKSEGGAPCLEDFRNRVVYTNSFTVSQRDMLASACRATDTREDEWTMSKRNAKEWFELGQRQVKEGKMAGFSKLLYPRVFFPGDGDFERTRGTINGILGLPKEDLDGATMVAIERQRDVRH